MAIITSKGKSPSELLYAWTVQTPNGRKRPGLVEIGIDRETDAAMGVGIDNVEGDPVIDLPEGTPGRHPRD